MKHPAERLVAALPPDAARALLAWIEAARPGDRIQVVIERCEHGVGVTLPRRYTWRDPANPAP